MKKILFVVFTFFALSSLAQTDVSWYKMLQGTIGKYPITMHLHKAGHSFFGYYYYAAAQQPIYFVGDDTTQKEKLSLMAFAPGQNEEETFSFSLINDKATGTWKAGANKQKLSFQAAEEKLPLSFTYVFASGTTMLRPKVKESPAASFEAGSVWPEGTTATTAFLKSRIREIFFPKSSSKEEIGSLLLKEKKNFLNDYIKDNKDVSDKEIKESPIAYTMDESSRMMIAYQSVKLLTLAFWNYAYTGGAHGNYGTSYIAMDLVNNKILKLSDVLNERGRKSLSNLLAKYFRKQYHLKTSDALQEGGLFENKIEPNNNFYLTAKGICFNYVPYEIGPYAMGEVMIFIPFTELQSYLQPSLKKLIQ